MTFEAEVKLAKQQFEMFRPSPDGMVPIVRTTSRVGQDRVALLAGLDSPEERLEALVGLTIEHQAVRMVSLADTWVRILEPGEAIPEGRVRDDPHRGEALVVSLVTVPRIKVGIYPYLVLDGKVVWDEDTTVLEDDVRTQVEGMYKAVQNTMLLISLAH
jgi:hypothetical protein